MIDSGVARDDSRTVVNPVNSENGGAISEDTKGVTLKINLVMVDNQAAALDQQAQTGVENKLLTNRNRRDLTQRMQVMSQQFGNAGENSKLASQRFAVAASGLGKDIQVGSYQMSRQDNDNVLSD